MIRKPEFRSPCNRCGLCCRLELCRVADLAFPGQQAPCPSLLTHKDGTTSCELVVIEQKIVKAEPDKVPLIAMGLGIGYGCGMRDDCPDVDYENQCSKNP